jgi:hypothetical protein
MATGLHSTTSMRHSGSPSPELDMAGCCRQPPRGVAEERRGGGAAQGPRWAAPGVPVPDTGWQRVTVGGKPLKSVAPQGARVYQGQG